jgi:subtilase family serine protease
MNSEYDYLLDKYKPKINRFQIFYQVMMLLFLGSFASIFIYLLVTLYPSIQNVNNLIEKISNEIDYYHSIVSLHNQTIFDIENKISNIVSKNEIISIVYNLNRITSQLNVTLIQSDLNTIANDLNKVIPH